MSMGPVYKPIQPILYDRERNSFPISANFNGIIPGKRRDILECGGLPPL